RRSFVALRDEALQVAEAHLGHLVVRAEANKELKRRRRAAAGRRRQEVDAPAAFDLELSQRLAGGQGAFHVRPRPSHADAGRPVKVRGQALEGLAGREPGGALVAVEGDGNLFALGGPAGATLVLGSEVGRLLLVVRQPQRVTHAGILPDEGKMTAGPVKLGL